MQFHRKLKSKSLVKQLELSAQSAKKKSAKENQTGIAQVIKTAANSLFGKRSQVQNSQKKM